MKTPTIYTENSLFCSGLWSAVPHPLTDLPRNRAPTRRSPAVGNAGIPRCIAPSVCRVGVHGSRGKAHAGPNQPIPPPPPSQFSRYRSLAEERIEITSLPKNLSSVFSGRKVWTCDM